jgi:integrase
MHKLPSGIKSLDSQIDRCAEVTKNGNAETQKSREGENKREPTRPIGRGDQPKTTKALQMAASTNKETVSKFLSAALEDRTTRQQRSVTETYHRLLRTAGMDGGLPARIEELETFICILTSAGYAYETVQKYTGIVQVASRRLYDRAYTSWESDRVKLALRAAKKLAGQAGNDEKSRTATLTADDLRAVAQLPDSKATVMILVGVALLLRFKELCDLKRSDIEVKESMTVVTIRRSKTDIGAKGCQLTLGCICQKGGNQASCPHHRLKTHMERERGHQVFSWDHRQP